ncbi:MAG: D-2-hydroxyacid dehydrogenase [Gemmatimonadota bacterium]|nr:D-2-hydroxyacid dehydrogenase [Gemmatimonadota bacterium]
MPDTPDVTILIASYIEPDLVDRIRDIDPRLDVVYEPGLLRPPRYAADHTGAAIERSAEDERRWRGLLARADVLFDFDQTHIDDLPDLAPRVRWIQATSAGIGERVAAWGYAERMPGTLFTTASGVHAGPLAEFCLLGMLAFTRELFTMVDQQRRRDWTRFAGTDLRGRTLVIYGHGSIGAEVARTARSFGMYVIGVRRSPGNVPAAELHADEIVGADELASVLPRAEFLVLAAPHTPETEGAVGRSELGLLPEGAVLINVGRGSLVDEPALIDALATGRLGGAVLDVFATEPLPADSPLWNLPNVLVSPHSAATSDRENARIVELFCENLRRYLSDRPLLNVLDTARRY